MPQTHNSGSRRDSLTRRQKEGRGIRSRSDRRIEGRANCEFRVNASQGRRI